MADSWHTATPIHLASYVMWRLNWIHPFPDGNGRTSRAGSYLVMCAKLGYLIPGHTTIPHRIAADKRTYYRALEAADNADQEGRIDVSAMESVLETFLEAQLQEVHDAALGKRERTPVPPGPAWNND